MWWGYRATSSSRNEGYWEGREEKQSLRVSSSQPWHGLCLQMTKSGHIYEQNLSPRHTEKGWTNKTFLLLCFLVSRWIFPQHQEKWIFRKLSGQNVVQGFWRTAHWPDADISAVMEIHPGKTQKGGKLERFGKSCGQGSLKISKPGLKGGFSCIEPTRFPVPQTSIAALIVLALHPSALTKILCFFHRGKDVL